MPGFIFAYGSLTTEYSFSESENLICDSIRGDNFWIQRKTLDKFLDDKLFYESSDLIIILEGVILNKLELLKNSSLDWEKYVQELYSKNGDDFFNIFRGSFSGILFDKKKDKWIVFSDHIGSKHVYYAKINDNYIFASDIIDIYKWMSFNKLNILLDVNSAYMLLSYGFMLEDFTLCKDVKKLLPGNYIKLESNKIEVQQYYKLSNKPNHSLSESDIVDKIDKLFRQAISRQFDKDIEYNYKHFVALSGGLDSRMTTMVAHEMGYLNQLNFTFSQSDYLDETIPKKISSDLNHEWIFKALDNGLFLKQIDTIAKISGGNSIYYGMAHGMSLFQYLNFKELGICHSGQLGDVILGTYSSGDEHKSKYEYKSGGFSSNYIDKIDFSKIKIEYENEELFKFYQRGFSGINSGLLGVQQFTETMSPFYDIDLFEFALTIPLKYRYKHKIYRKWIKMKYPKVNDYIWEKTGKKPCAKIFYLNYKSKAIELGKVPYIILYKLGFAKNRSNTKKGMNPLDYYYNSNKELSHFMDEYFSKSIIKLNRHGELKKNVNNLYNGYMAMEKILALTLISALNQFDFD